MLATLLYEHTYSIAQRSLVLLSQVGAGAAGSATNKINLKNQI